MIAEGIKLNNVYINSIKITAGEVIPLSDGLADALTRMALLNPIMTDFPGYNSPVLIELTIHAHGKVVRLCCPVRGDQCP
jgi:hypothetical protein